MKVPFAKSVLLPEHQDFTHKSLVQGMPCGGGAFTKSCESLLRKTLGTEARIVTSATHALEIMALLIKIEPGDEVICPSFTFVSTANAFLLRGARPVFADNDEFGNIKPSEIQRLITRKTKAVIAVDYAGASADLDQIRLICDQHKICFLQDSAQSIGALYKDRPLGTQSDLSCLSFHETKNIGCGEGGALLINSPKWLERAEIIRDKGTNRAHFFQGLVDKYTWVDVGSSYVLSDLNAAYLKPQLEQVAELTHHRGQLWKTYEEELKAPLQATGISILGTPSHNSPNFHIFGLMLPNPEMRASFIQFMLSNGISTPFHYVALHQSPMGSKFHTANERLPGCEKFSSCLVRLPLFHNLQEVEQGYVISKTREWLKKL